MTVDDPAEQRTEEPQVYPPEFLKSEKGWVAPLKVALVLVAITALLGVIGYTICPSSYSVYRAGYGVRHKMQGKKFAGSGAEIDDVQAALGFRYRVTEGPGDSYTVTNMLDLFPTCLSISDSRSGTHVEVRRGHC